MVGQVYICVHRNGVYISLIFVNTKIFPFLFKIKGSSLLCNEWALICCSRKTADASYTRTLVCTYHVS